MKRKLSTSKSRKKSRTDQGDATVGSPDSAAGRTTPLMDVIVSHDGADFSTATLPQQPGASSAQPVGVHPPVDNDEILESPDAAHVGVQLALLGGHVRDVLVAGRPTSPFTGTMGDHVTAFGVHVVNLRRAMQGKDLTEARKGMIALVDAMKSLPGAKLISGGNSDWRSRLAALEAAVRESPGGSEDAQLAALQRIAALYLEVREGIPLSLLNTRSLTADAGKGRGEAKWLQQLAAGPPQRQTKRTRVDGDGATPEQLAIALGLFDDDASAMLTFNRSTNQPQHVTGLLPDHTNIDAIMRTDPVKLAEMMALQHAMSLFPNAGTAQIEEIAKAVLEKLRSAHQARAEADGAEWKRRLGTTLSRIKLAADSMDTPASWLKQQKAMPEDVESALRNLGLLTSGAPGDFREKLTAVYATVPDAVESAFDVASVPNHPERKALVSAVRTFLGQFRANMEKIEGEKPATLRKENLAQTESALVTLQQKTTDAASKTPDVPEQQTKDVDIQPASESAELTRKRDLPEASMSVDSGRNSNGSELVSRRRLVAPRTLPDFGAGGRAGQRKANLQEKESARAVLRELSSGTGNSFTVALQLGPARRITSVGLRGRTPSPFKGTMGAHATAWVVWVRAVENLVKDTTVDEAGKNLVRFAEGIMVDAESQENLPGNAQNGQRRFDARWNEGSLDAWRTVLKDHEANPWTVSSLQAYAQAVLTFVNMLPGTTRTGKNTDGHGEAKAWNEAKLNYLSGNDELRRQALAGAGLFDAGTNAWVRPRHLALMGVALGGRQSDAWQKWPQRQ